MVDIFDSIRGKVVLVTGGSRGIGKEISRHFHMYGAKVAINYNSSKEEALKLKQELGNNAEIYKADVSKREEVRRMVKEIEETLGKVNILVNNAGVMYAFPFEQYDEEKFNKMWDINFKGTLYTTLEVLPHMKENKGGVIINIASNAGIGTAFEGTTFYAISKAAVIMLTKRLAFELGKYGIRVNAIAPGWVETDMTIGGKSPEEIVKIEEFMKARTSLRMVGKPEYIAKFALFLAVADYLTGQVIVIDGGRLDNLTHSV
ncbi:MAG: glucose 1-dehydrogenase [Sulfolobaceae archaeon]|nr:glucose 1-dehydrogenase [Sulfolobaceae archaeon]